MKRTVLVVLAVAASAAACSATPGGSAASAAVTASAGTAVVSTSPSVVVTPSPAAASPSAASASTSPSAVPSPTPAPTPNLSACPTDQAGNLALARALNRTLALADGRSIKFSTAAIGARNDSWSADDAIPAFATLDLKMAPDRAASDGTYAIAGSPGMTLTAGVARAYRRSQLSGASGPGVTISGSPQELDVSVVDGKLVLHMPSTADTWVIDLSPQWQTACLRGDGAAYPIVTTP